jgi:hypothetical protein
VDTGSEVVLLAHAVILSHADWRKRARDSSSENRKRCSPAICPLKRLAGSPLTRAG